MDVVKQENVCHPEDNGPQCLSLGLKSHLVPNGSEVKQTGQDSFYRKTRSTPRIRDWKVSPGGPCLTRAVPACGALRTDGQSQPKSNARPRLPVPGTETKREAESSRKNDNKPTGPRRDGRRGLRKGPYARAVTKDTAVNLCLTWPRGFLRPCSGLKAQPRQTRPRDRSCLFP